MESLWYENNADKSDKKELSTLTFHTPVIHLFYSKVL